MIQKGNGMGNTKIAEILKYYRKLNDMSVEDVSEELKGRNIVAAPKTIYGWESGRTSPAADTSMNLCKIYNITDVLAAFGYAGQDESLLLKDLNEEEKKVLLAYRNLPQMQPAVKKLLGVESDSSTK